MTATPTSPARVAAAQRQLPEAAAGGHVHNLSGRIHGGRAPGIDGEADRRSRRTRSRPGSPGAAPEHRSYVSAEADITQERLMKTMSITLRWTWPPLALTLLRLRLRKHITRPRPCAVCRAPDTVTASGTMPHHLRPAGPGIGVYCEGTRQPPGRPGLAPRNWTPAEHAELRSGLAAARRLLDQLDLLDSRYARRVPFPSEHEHLMDD